MMRILAFTGLLLVAVPAAAQDAALSGAAKGRELMAAGRYEASLPFFQRELDQAEAKLGPDNPSVAAEINDLAEANRLAGRYKAAEALYLRAIELDEKARGKDPAGLATTLNNLALVYREQGRLEEAERLHTRSLNLLRGHAGPQRRQGGHEPAQSRRRLPGAGPDRRGPAPAGAGGGGRGQEPRAPATPMPSRCARPWRRWAARRRPGRPRPCREAPGAQGRGQERPATAAAAGARPHRPAPAGGGFAVQLASVPKADQVPGEWRRLVKRYPDLSALELQPAQSVEVAGKGTFYRVIAGPLASQGGGGGVVRPAEEGRGVLPSRPDRDRGRPAAAAAPLGGAVRRRRRPRQRGPRDARLSHPSLADARPVLPQRRDPGGRDRRPDARRGRDGAGLRAARADPAPGVLRRALAGLCRPRWRRPASSSSAATRSWRARPPRLAAGGGTAGASRWTPARHRSALEAFLSGAAAAFGQEAAMLAPGEVERFGRRPAAGHDHGGGRLARGRARRRRQPGARRRRWPSWSGSGAGPHWRRQGLARACCRHVLERFLRRRWRARLAVGGRRGQRRALSRPRLRPVRHPAQLCRARPSP